MPNITNSPIITASGQLSAGVVTTAKIADSNVTPAKLSAGTDGQVMTTTGSTPGWAASASTPTGTILGYDSATPPANFLLADGSAVSRTTYAALFAVCGTTYGVGDGSTTFNLPVGRSRTSGYRFSYANSKTQGAATSISMSHIITYPGELVLFGISVASGSPAITSVQFNGAAMTAVNTSNAFVQWFVYVNPPVGTYNITASWSGSLSANCISASYAGFPAGTTFELQSTSTGSSVTTLQMTSATTRPSLVALFFASSDISSTVPTLTNSIVRKTLVSASSQNMIIGEVIPLGLTGTVTFPSSNIYGFVASFKAANSDAQEYAIIKT